MITKLTFVLEALVCWEKRLHWGGPLVVRSDYIGAVLQWEATTSGRSFSREKRLHWGGPSVVRSDYIGAVLQMRPITPRRRITARVGVAHKHTFLLKGQKSLTYAWSLQSSPIIVSPPYERNIFKRDIKQ